MLVQRYRTDLNDTVASFVVPTGMTANRLMVEVHYCDPYNLTLNASTPNLIEWAMYATDPSKTVSGENEAWADG